MGKWMALAVQNVNTLDSCTRTGFLDPKFDFAILFYIGTCKWNMGEVANI